MASYDYNDANRNEFKGYELDRGLYNIFVGKNANAAWNDISGRAALANRNLTYTVPVTATRTGFLYNEENERGYKTENRFDDVSSHFLGDTPKATLLTRSSLSSSMPKTPTAADRAASADFIESLKYVANDEGKPWYVSPDKMPKQGWKPGQEETAHKLYELIKRNDATGEISVDYNDNRWDNILDQLTVKEMAYLIGTGSFNTDYIESISKPKTTDADGPAGFTNFMGDPTVYETCFYASECVIAATWNQKLVHDMGVMVGNEGIWGNQKVDKRPYSGWYAPAVNIHRSPFSGRNFEYYSEDPYLSGMMGASVVQGAKAKGVYTYVKHFAVNDQETDRDNNGLITWLTEQTMREIYLRPFEIIVKTGKTTAMMSAFNRIGTVWAGGSYPLCTEVLRGEWGFKGMVISDYNLSSYMPADQMIRAGGDLNLTQNDQPSTGSSALTATQVTCIRNAVKNILYTVAGSNGMNGMGEGVVWGYRMPYWMLGLILGNVALAAGFAVWGFFAIRKSYKRKNGPAEKAAQ